MRGFFSRLTAPLIATGQLDRGHRALAAGRVEEAEDLLERALEAARALPAGARRDHLLAGAAGPLGTLQADRELHGRAATYYEERLEARRRLYAGSEAGERPAAARSLAGALGSLAAVRISLGQRGQARPLLDEAVELYRAVLSEQSLPDDPLGLAALHNNRAQLGLADGDLAAAEEDLRQALAAVGYELPEASTSGEAVTTAVEIPSRERSDPALLEAIAAFTANLGEVLQERGRPEAAEPLYRQALARFEAVRDRGGDPDREHWAHCLERYAELYVQNGHLAEASRLRARAEGLRSVPGDPPEPG